MNASIVKGAKNFAFTSYGYRNKLTNSHYYSQSDQKSRKTHFSAFEYDGRVEEEYATDNDQVFQEDTK